MVAQVDGPQSYIHTVMHRRHFVQLDGGLRLRLRELGRMHPPCLYRPGLI